MSERDNEADPQTKIRLINPLAYTHSGATVRQLRQMRQARGALHRVRLWV